MTNVFFSHPQGLSEEALEALLAAIQEREGAVGQLFAGAEQPEGHGAACGAKPKKVQKRRAAAKEHDSTSSDKVWLSTFKLQYLCFLLFSFGEVTR